MMIPLRLPAPAPRISAFCRMARLCLLLLLATGTSLAQLVDVGDGTPGPFKAPHLTVELVTLAPQIAAGGTQQIGLSFTIEEKWHVYFQNAGDSGEPPAIIWKLPKGITADPLRFPAPEFLPLGPLMDFGYRDAVTFPITLTAAPKLKPGKVHLDARVSWLVCSSQCLPGKAHLGIDLNVAVPPIADPQLVGALGSTLRNMPRPLPSSMSASALGDAHHIALTVHTGGREEDAELFPLDPDQIANAADQQVESLADGIRVTLLRDPDAKSLPETFRALVKLSDTESYIVAAPVVPGTIATGSAPKPRPDEQLSGITLPRALVLAFLGGILLNLMPCVFPVLFLKGLALVNSSTHEQSKQRKHGLVYTLGILVSFWSVVAVLLLLRAGGRQLGWGFQLQSPSFVAVLAALTFLLALSLAGQFELGLSLTSAGDTLTRRQGFAGSFFTGVLATIVATPCMGPLMGAAIGFALAQSALLTFLVFTALALGLAFPYLLLTMQPGYARLLPRPGAWMEYLKQATALPLFGTAIWLTWVYGHLYDPDGIDRAVALLACFLVLAIAGWALGRWPARWSSAIAAVVLIAAALALPLHHPAEEKLTWQPFTEASLAEARASGHPVFIDFTASWCLSCQVNEKLVLRSDAVVKKFAETHTVLIKADWTRYDPAITKQLATLNRSGVPAYVLFPPGKTSDADVLPEVLTQSLVLTAITRDSKALGAP